METLAIYRADLAERPEITAALFSSFVEYVDRTATTTRTYLTNLRQFMAYLRYTATSRPQRHDVIAYRNYLASEHDAIVYAPQMPQKWVLMK